jgi:hypothetical protein
MSVYTKEEEDFLAKIGQITTEPDAPIVETVKDEVK